MSHTDPMSRQPYNDPAPYGHAPAPAPGHEPYPARRGPGDGSGQRRTALVIQAIGDVAAGFLGLWIVLYLLDANRANPFVGFVQGAAEFFGWWAEDIFTMEVEGLRILLNFGLPALIYLALGHGIATWLRRL
ncbi:hypothetical protein [Streptomyces cavernicola]|uniref:YggT family protein n=1 Tax=Streptomyces cavernicola TaxID=3043613 RepID=A0ABT6S7Q1_9ACTN|nr:hypothetical protein [Streptomyces sp. B-S-A6]MDI3404062.1 hypothetical protein [Streptomyces sp. B-S-A6]